MQTRKWSWSLILAGAVVTAACGDSKSSLNPTAPSAISADNTLSAEAGDEGGEYSTNAKPDNGNGNGNGNGNNGGGNGNGNGGGNGNQPRTPTNTSPAPTAPVPPGKAKVEIEGLISATGGNTITVRGQVVTVTPDTVIRHGNRRFEFSNLNVGDRVHVRAARVASTGSGALASASTLEAQEIKLQNPGDGDDGEEEPSALVSVVAFDASASEAGVNPGSFRLTRTGDLTQLASALAVSFTLTGTALNGTDYVTVPLTATFPGGQATVDVQVTPIADGFAEESETVILTLTTVPAPYELGSPVAATVDLSDAANPLVSVTASDPSASESGDPGAFTLTRTGSLAAPLEVTIVVSGSATPGFDYTPVPTTVNFLAGQATATVSVTPLTDAAPDLSETVIVTIVDAAAYDLGAVSTATVTIVGS